MQTNMCAPCFSLFCFLFCEAESQLLFCTGVLGLIRDVVRREDALLLSNQRDKVLGRNRSGGDTYEIINDLTCLSMLACEHMNLLRHCSRHVLQIQGKSCNKTSMTAHIMQLVKHQACLAWRWHMTCAVQMQKLFQIEDGPQFATLPFHWRTTNL